VTLIRRIVHSADRIYPTEIKIKLAFFLYKGEYKTDTANTCTAHTAFVVSVLSLLHS